MPMTIERADAPLEDPQARLERAFIDEYLRSHDIDPARLGDLPAERRRVVLRDAAQFAALKLAEVDARAAYVHDIHGASSPS